MDATYWSLTVSAPGRKDGEAMSEHIYGGVPIEHGAAKGETRLERREEIVRCRDCMHCNDEGIYTPAYFCLNDHFVRPSYAMPTEPNGFCAWAERRER